MAPQGIHIRENREVPDLMFDGCKTGFHRPQTRLEFQGDLVRDAMARVRVAMAPVGRSIATSRTQQCQSEAQG